MLVRDTHQVREHIGGLPYEVLRMLLEDSHSFCQLAQFLKEAERASWPICNLALVNSLEHCLPLIKRCRPLAPPLAKALADLGSVCRPLEVSGFAADVFVAVSKAVGATAWVFSENQLLGT